MIEAIDDDIIQLKIDKNKRIIIENPKDPLPKNLKVGDYINIVDEKTKNIESTQAKELLEIESNLEKNIITIKLLNENVRINLNGNIETPQIRNFLNWLGKFIKYIKFENQKVNNTPENIKKTIINFIKNFIKEVGKSIIENKNLKIPDPKTSAKIINTIITPKNDNNLISKKGTASEHIIKNNERESKIKTKMETSNIIKDNNETDIKNIKQDINNGKNIIKEKFNQEQNLNGKSRILHKALNAYKTFAQFDTFNEPNFIFFQLFGIPVFLSVNDEIELIGSNKKNIKRIAFSFISDEFGLVNSIIYKKDNAISLNFFIEKNNDIFKENIDGLIQDIQRDGIKIEGLQINELEKEIEINKKGLYG